MYPDQHHRIVLAGVFTGDIVQARGGRGDGLIAAGARPYRFDDVTFGVAEQGGDLIEFLRCIQFDDAVAFGAIDVHDVETKPLRHAGCQHQAGCVHRIGESEI